MAYMFSSYRLVKKPLKAKMVGVEEKLHTISSRVHVKGTAGYPNIAKGGYLIWVEAPNIFGKPSYAERRKQIRDIVEKYFSKKGK